MRRVALCLTGGLLACALLAYVYLRHRQIRAQQEKPFGDYTEQQMIERTIPFCQTLLGQTDDLRLEAERGQSTTPDRKPRLWWSLQCTNTRAEVLAVFLWDAKTGELVKVSHLTTARAARDPVLAPRPPTRTQEQTKGRAAFLSYRWLHRLGMAKEGSRWRLVQEPERCAKGMAVWYTRWRSSDHEASVQVDVGSSELVSAQSWLLSEATFRAQ
jgi:hypothetical protein